MREKPLRVALLSYRSHPYSGGQGIYVSALSAALVNEGVEVDVISGPPYPQLDPRVTLIKLPSLDLYEHGLRSLRLRHMTSLSNVIEWFSKLTGGFAEPYTFGRRVLRYFKRVRPDYDIVHDNQTLASGVLALESLSYPVVATIHHPISSDLRLALEAEPVWWRRLLIRRWHSFLRMQIPVSRHIQRIFAVSESAAHDIQKEFGVKAARIMVTGIGTDTELFKPLPGRVKDPNRVMITASSDAALKGVVYALRAFALLRQRFPNLRLRLVGRLREDGPAQRALDELGLAPYIDQVSRVNQAELVAYYNEASVFMAASLYEGFGLPVAEAMACGTSVVVSDGGALPEVVGEAGVVVPRGDVDALATAVGALLDSLESRGVFERLGPERIRNVFSWKACAQRTIAEYERVIANADR
jgi:glycosyltransferase involved in cell wall biosynthesis